MDSLALKKVAYELGAGGLRLQSQLLGRLRLRGYQFEVSQVE
jgi:hypothetical protein